MTRERLPKELCTYANQLERAQKLIALGGDGQAVKLIVQVADPDYLREMLIDAMLEIIELRQLALPHPERGSR